MAERSNNGILGGNGKAPKARMLFSTRMTLAVMCMLGTGNFMYQRLTINFGLVCMVKNPVSLNDTFADLPLVTQNDSTTTATKFDPQGEFEWSRDSQGAILAAFYFGFVFSQIPGGWFSDRFGAKSGLVFSGLFLSILSILTPASAYLGPQYVFLLRLLQGLVNGAAMPAISTLSSRWFPDTERSFMMSIAYAGFGIASSFTYPISAFFCEYTGWPVMFYVTGSVGLCWTVCICFLIYDWPENHPRISMTELQFVQKRRAVPYGGSKREKIKIPWVRLIFSLPVWALLVANFCCFWLFLTMGMYLPTFLKEVLKLDISQNGLLSALPFAGMMISHFLVAIVFDKLRKRKFCSVTVLRKTFNTIGALSAAGCMVAIGFLDNSVFPAVFAITLAQVLLEMSFIGGYIFSIFEMAPKFAGTLTALMNTFGLLAGFLSPALVSHLTPNGTREEWLLIFYISAGICAFGGVFYLLFGSSELQPWAGVADTRSGTPVIDERELKLLKIKLINGESNINGEVVKN